MKRFIKFFTSVKLAIVLLIILAAASILGTLIPQGRSARGIRGPLRADVGSVHPASTDRPLSFRLVPRPSRPLRPEHHRLHARPASAPSGGGRAAPARIRRQEPRGAEGQRPDQAERARRRTPWPKLKSAARRGAVTRSGASPGPRIDLLGPEEDLGHLRLRHRPSRAPRHHRRRHPQRPDRVREADRPSRRADHRPSRERISSSASTSSARSTIPTGASRTGKATLTVLESGKPVLDADDRSQPPADHTKATRFYQSSYGWNWDNPAVEIWAQEKERPGLPQDDQAQGRRAGRPRRQGRDDGRASPASSPISSSANRTRPKRAPSNPTTRPPWSKVSRARRRSFRAGSSPTTPTSPRCTPRQGRADLSFELKIVRSRPVLGPRSGQGPGRRAHLARLHPAHGRARPGLLLADLGDQGRPRRRQDKTDVILGGLAAKSREAFQAPNSTPSLLP